MKKILTMLVVSLLVLSMISVLPLIHAEGATISTDKTDYTSGETVIIYGSGFLEGAVTITVTRPDGSTNEWAVTSDGSFTTTYLLDGIEGTYTVVATQGTITASTTFTDNPGPLVYSPSRYPDTGSASVAQGSSISFDLTITADYKGQTNVIYDPKLVAVGGWRPLPTGWISFDPSTLTLSQGVSKTTKVTISIPSGADLGAYRIVIKFAPRTTPSSPEGSGCDVYITVTPALVPTAPVTFGQVGVDTDFTGTVLTVDGTTPDYWGVGVGGLLHTYTWNVGDSHTFAYGSPLVVPSGDKQYVWTSTSGLPGSPQSGTIIVPSGGASVTGYYKTQYKITVTAAPTEAIGGTFDVTYTKCGTVYTLTGTTPWSDWADADTTETPSIVTVSNPQDIITDGPGTRYRFDYYVPSSGSVTMTYAQSITLVYKTQYKIIVTAAPAGAIGGTFDVTYTECGTVYALTDRTTTWSDWADAGTKVTVSSPQEYVPNEAGVGGVRYRFDYYVPSSGIVTMTYAETITLVYKTQYYLTVNTDPTDVLTLNPSAVSGWGWYDSGDTATVDAVQNVDKVAGESRYDFRSWTGATPGVGNKATVYMDGPKTATANYKLQYYLTVTKSPSDVATTPSGSGWYDEGDHAPISTKRYVDIISGSSRYRFNGWTTPYMTEITDPSLLSTTVLMDKAKTVTANYVKQYFLTVKIDPALTPPLVTISGEGWYDEGTDVPLTAPLVDTGYIFVYWDVDGTATKNSLIYEITVHMGTWHTATAHYWLELGFETYVTDSNFKKIDHFDTVWTPQDTKKTMFKLSATNPGQFMYNIKITNTWPATINTLPITFSFSSDFVTHGADPIQVWTMNAKTGTRIYPTTITYTPGTPGTPTNGVTGTPGTPSTGTITILNIAPGQTLYITIHLEYRFAGQIFPKATKDGWKTVPWHTSYTFTAGYTVTVPGPFPFPITRTSSKTLLDPTVTLGE
jgi:hypothetical protein